LGKKVKTKINRRKNMRRILFLLGIILFVNSTGLGQVLLIEHFPYANKDEFTSGGWAIHDSGSKGYDIAILSGSLSYPGYMTGEGNRVELAYNRDIDRSRSLGSQFSSGGLYCSFLLKVTGDPSTSGGYFLHFMASYGAHGATVYIKKVGTNTFDLGVRVRPSTSDGPQWANRSFEF
jgi:hypothetical protein